MLVSEQLLTKTVLVSVLVCLDFSNKNIINYVAYELLECIAHNSKKSKVKGVTNLASNEDLLLVINDTYLLHPHKIDRARARS